MNKKTTQMVKSIVILSMIAYRFIVQVPIDIIATTDVCVTCYT